MELLEAWGKAGILVLLGVLLTAWASRITSKETYKIALRRLENEEEAELQEREAKLRTREVELHKEALQLLASQLAECRTAKEALEAEMVRRKSQPYPPD